MQSGSSRSLAPAKRMMGSMKAMVTMESTTPSPATHQMNREKYREASSGFPSPRVRATMALPPVPSMKPKAPMIMVMGKAMFTADRARSPTRLDTNSPSTTLYSEVKIIMMMDGSVYRSSRP